VSLHNIYPLSELQMSNSTMYQFRIDETEKAETFAVLNDLGMKPAQAIRLFFRQIRQTKSIPFAIEHTPNALTAKNLLGDDYSKSFDSVEALLADLQK
jgi:DNA-damage-inducible protein J